MKLYNIYNSIKNLVPRITFEKKEFGSIQELYLKNGVTDTNYNLSLFASLFYYAIISPVSTGIDIIGDEFESINPMILDLKTLELERNNPLIQLLTLPNSDQTKSEIFGAMARFLKITGNCFLIATGDIRRPPLELVVITPTFISIQESLRDNFPESYTYQSNSISMVFHRLEENGRLRFVNKKQTAELWHIRDFNPGIYKKLWGFSRLNSIYLEIDQFFSSNKHNLSLLKKGVRASGIISTDAKLTTDQADSMQSQLNSDFKGDVNAGNVFLFSGGKFDFKEMSQTLKDMDFKNLKKDMKEDIYNRLEIPLPLISSSNQKFDNMRQAKLILWDNAVTPLTKKIFNELSLFLFPRYNLDPNLQRLWFNFLEIPVLRERHIQETTDLLAKKVITTNEARISISLPVLDGGDVIYIPSTEIPLGTNPIGQSEQKSLKLKKELKKIKYKNGKSVYDIEEI